MVISTEQLGVLLDLTKATNHFDLNCMFTSDHVLSEGICIHWIK